MFYVCYRKMFVKRNQNKWKASLHIIYISYSLHRSRLWVNSCVCLFCMHMDRISCIGINNVVMVCKRNPWPKKSLTMFTLVNWSCCWYGETRKLCIPNWSRMLCCSCGSLQSSCNVPCCSSWFISNILTWHHRYRLVMTSLKRLLQASVCLSSNSQLKVV